MRAFLFNESDFQIDVTGGAPVPPGAQVVEAADGVSVRDLVWNGQKLVDRNKVTAWYIDDNGVPRAYRGQNTWPAYTGGFESTVRDSSGSFRRMTASEKIAPKIQAECSRRITDRFSDNSQKNITAYATKLVKDVIVLGRALSDAEKHDLSVADEIFSWINGESGMVAACRAMIVAAEPDYQSNTKWPTWDPNGNGWSDLIARF
jgi:hypothetical protein